MIQRRLGGSPFPRGLAHGGIWRGRALLRVGAWQCAPENGCELLHAHAMEQVFG